MKTSRRLAAVLAAALTSITMAGSPALAAAPGNDSYAGAVAITSLAFNTSLDTTEATTDADDVEVNTDCGAPATDASVWYSFTPSADTALVADVSSSSYSAGVSVATGAPGSFALVTCGPGAVAWDAASGVTYTILVFDDQLDGDGVAGGMMSLSVDVMPPAPSIEATVDPIGTFNARTGSVTLTGTVTCDASAGFASLDLMLSQQVGRFIVRGYGYAEAACDGTPQAWSAEVFGDNGLFKGGKAVNVTFAFACNLGGCSDYGIETTVRLTGKK